MTENLRISLFNLALEPGRLWSDWIQALTDNNIEFNLFAINK